MPLNWVARRTAVKRLPLLLESSKIAEHTRNIRQRFNVSWQIACLMQLLQIADQFIIEWEDINIRLDRTSVTARRVRAVPLHRA